MNAFGIVKLIKMPAIGTLDQFTAYLKFMHGIILASEDLLLNAISTSVGPLQDYFKAHLEEERGHAEWLLRDLDALNVRPPSIDHAAAQIAGVQYYYIRHVGAFSFLGYLVALEGNPMPPSSVAALEKAFGPACCRTLRYHSEHDPEHALKLREMVEMHNDNVIDYNAAMTAVNLSHYLRERMHHA